MHVHAKHAQPGVALHEHMPVSDMQAVIATVMVLNDIHCHTDLSWRPGFHCAVCHAHVVSIGGKRVRVR